MTSCCKHGNEPVGSTRGRKFHNQLGDYLWPQELCFTVSHNCCSNCALNKQGFTVLLTYLHICVIRFFSINTNFYITDFHSIFCITIWNTSSAEHINKDTFIYRYCKGTWTSMFSCTKCLQSQRDMCEDKGYNHVGLWKATWNLFQ